ncbi:unnamed protein product [Pieris brassicae]|uniref:Reverse transcriptase domain-containing protein n=1 Tax=Pieris brassicae TaxID=7116 RepID=A0A9P0TNG7_PIEBR|nr:unnamed protein product [Pieris brassicae]
MELFDNRYTVYHRDRSSSTNTKSDGGDVILRVEAWESDTEDLWVTLHININQIIKKLSICVVYLPPPVKIGTLTHFLDSIDRALNLSDDVIILGGFSKLFESVLYRIISKSIESCIIDEQHGFRGGRSIQTNLMSFVTETC